MFKMNTSKALFLSLLSLTPCALYSTDVPSEINFTAIVSMKRHYRDFRLNGQVYNIPEGISGPITLVQGPLINIASDSTVVPYSYTITDTAEDGVTREQGIVGSIVFRNHFPVPNDLYRLSFRFDEGRNQTLSGVQILQCFTDVYCGTAEENRLYATFHQAGEQLDQNHKRPRNIRFSAVIQEKNEGTISKLGENRIDSFKIISVISGPFNDYTERSAIVDQAILRSGRIDLATLPYDDRIITCNYSLKIHGRNQEDLFRYTVEPKSARPAAFKLKIFLKPDNTVTMKGVTCDN